MAIRIYTSCLAIGLAFVGLRATASAADIEFATAGKLAAWEKRVDRLEQRLANFEQTGGEAESNATESYTDGGCITPGLTAQVELLFLRAYNTDADFDSDSDSQRFKECVRLTLGWTGPGGVGIRGRWFEFDLNTDDSNFQLQVADVEVTARIDLDRDWYARLSGGGRYAEWVESQEANRLEGALGPVVGLEVGRYLSDNVSLFASGRQALVFGRDLVESDLAVSATELQVGADLQYVWSGTTALYGRIAWEGQFWTGMATEDAETFGLTGLALAVGLTR